MRVTHKSTMHWESWTYRYENGAVITVDYRRSNREYTYTAGVKDSPLFPEKRGGLPTRIKAIMEAREHINASVSLRDELKRLKMMDALRNICESEWLKAKAEERAREAETELALHGETVHSCPPRGFVFTRPEPA